MRQRALLPFALAALVGAAVAVLPAFAAAPAEVKLEVNENCVEANWPCWAPPGSGPNPEPAFKVTIAAGGEVKFVDNASTPATVSWAGTGSAPACSGVPASAMTKWEGACKFEQPGTYKFESTTLFNVGSLNYTKYEVVVESTSTGTTPTTTTATPTTTTTTTSTPTSEPSYGSPLGGSSTALKLARSQHGTSVHGSILVPPADAAGRLEVGLYAVGTSLAKAGKPVKVRVGRLVRSSLAGNSVSFSVPLNAKGKSALRRHRHLGLTVKVTLTPVHGAAVTVTRTVVLHA